MFSSRTKKIQGQKAVFVFLLTSSSLAALFNLFITFWLVVSQSVNVPVYRRIYLKWKGNMKTTKLAKTSEIVVQYVQCRQ